MKQRPDKKSHFAGKRCFQANRSQQSQLGWDCNGTALTNVTTIFCNKIEVVVCRHCSRNVVRFAPAEPAPHDCFRQASLFDAATKLRIIQIISVVPGRGLKVSHMNGGKHNA